MREIKFRGKKKSDGKWIVGNYNLIDGRAYIFNHDAGGDNLNSPDDYEVIPETVGQFTGIQDINGTDIYEGDNVQSTFMDRVFTIVWHLNGWKMRWNNNQNHYVGIFKDDVKIIGNIHEQKKQTR